MSAKSLKYALLLVELTSVPLIVLGLVYLLTGYQMLIPGIYIIPRARLIHTDKVLRITLVVLSALHAYTGILLMLHRRVKSKVLRDLLEVLVTTVILLLAVVITYVELLVK